MISVKAAAVAALVIAAAVGGAWSATPPQASDVGLTAFNSDEALRRFIRRATPRERHYLDDAVDVELVAPNGDGDAPSITSTQEAGVDEGGIVKARGDHLVVLRRGRLFTFSLAKNELRPIQAINAYPPGVDASQDWYDEMVLVGDRVVVIGYSYLRGGTEINRFRLGTDGRLTFEDAHHLRSGDYYSTQNYAARVIGGELIIYSPSSLTWDKDPLEGLPAVQQWRGGLPMPIKRIAQASDIYPAPGWRGDDVRHPTLHSVIRCDLGASELDCTSTGVIGAESTTFYVSPTAVYVWTSILQPTGRRPDAVVYRLPLRGGRPTALRAWGEPVDQFSFREDAAREKLQVLVQGWGEEGSSFGAGQEVSGVALLTASLSRFGSGLAMTQPSDYRHLPPIAGVSWDLLNRFIGRRLLYANGSDGASDLVIVDLDNADVDVFHTAKISRIEAMGRDALIVGQSERTVLTPVLLADKPRLGEPVQVHAAGEAESRSHAFFYSPDTAGVEAGLLGLPLMTSDGVEMNFMRRSENGALRTLGGLAARPLLSEDDGCVASCVDWYGGSRPIFLKGRVFALMGYEVVEARLENGRMREVRRANFAPSA